MMKRFRQFLACCTIAAVIFGCASSTPSRFYTLSTISVPVAASQALYSVSVGPITVPAVVDRPQIVIRTGPNQVTINEFDRWAAPLKDDIGRVVAENLSVVLGTSQVSLFPQSTAVGASYRVAIDIVHFDSDLGKSANLDAMWTVKSAKNEILRRGRTTLAEATRDAEFDALVAAHSRALGRLSTDIARAIKEIEAKKP